MVSADAWLAQVRSLRPDDADPKRRTPPWVRRALQSGLLDLPLPGKGKTRLRFDRLADLGTADLDLARLAEGHADAVAICAELEAPVDGMCLWGVWAANPPGDPLLADKAGDEWTLTGTKPWCSGAGCCDRALVTALAGSDQRLFAVDLRDSRVRPVEGTWPSPSMQGSDSRSMRFEAVPAQPVGAAGGYVDRPGFWHGAVGVAAVWWGGARGVAHALAEAHARRPLHAHALAHAGGVDAALAAAAAMLREAAAGFDDDPNDMSRTAALTAARVRAVVERSAADVLERTGRALGAAPIALNVEHGRRVADLGLYLRQSHAERDLEQLGQASLEERGSPWEAGLS